MEKREFKPGIQMPEEVADRILRALWKAAYDSRYAQLRFKEANPNYNSQKEIARGALEGIERVVERLFPFTVTNKIIREAMEDAEADYIEDFEK